MTGALIERLEKAEAGSRELDCEIMALSYVWERRHIGATCWDDRATGKRGDDHDDVCCPDAKHLDWVWVDPTVDKWKTNARDGFEFTTSLDVALALAERVLDGDHSYTLFHDWGGFNRASVQAITDGPVSGEGKAATMPLALCIAILKARTAASSSSPCTEGGEK